MCVINVCVINEETQAWGPAVLLPSLPPCSLRQSKYHTSRWREHGVTDRLGGQVLQGSLMARVYFSRFLSFSICLGMSRGQVTVKCILLPELC